MFKLKVKLYGESWKLKRISLTDEQKILWERIASKMKQPLYEVMIDPFFYHLLNDDVVKSIDDIEGEIWEGLLNVPKNQIEIWFKNKKVQKLKVDDLDNDLLLFPVFNIYKNNLTQNTKSGTYVIQKGIGLVGIYETTLTNFYIEDLQFELVNIDGLTILQYLRYKDKLLDVKKSDILITYQNTYIIN